MELNRQNGDGTQSHRLEEYGGSGDSGSIYLSSLSSKQSAERERERREVTLAGSHTLVALPRSMPRAVASREKEWGVGGESGGSGGW